MPACLTCYVLKGPALQSKWSQLSKWSCKMILLLGYKSFTWKSVLSQSTLERQGRSELWGWIRWRVLACKIRSQRVIWSSTAKVFLHKNEILGTWLKISPTTMHIEPNFMEALNFQTSSLLSIKDDQASGAFNRRESYNFDFLTDRNMYSGAVPTVDRQPIRTLSSLCQLCDRFSTRVGVF